MKRFLSSTFLLLLAIGFFSISSPVLASDPSYGLNDTAKAADLSQYNTPVPELIGNIIGTALSMISVVFFILAIYGGFRMMFARGKDDEFSKGKDILIHAIIGMIVILASYAITQFVFGSVKSGGVGAPVPTTPTPAVVQKCQVTGTLVAKCAAHAVVGDCTVDTDCTAIPNSSGAMVCIPLNTATCDAFTSASACTAASPSGCEWK
jgi:hypothetical protein